MMWQPMHGKGLAQYRRKGDGDAWRGRQGRADYSTAVGHAPGQANRTIMAREGGGAGALING